MNWIGVWTMIRREVARFIDAFIQSMVTPWVSALLYILIFGRIIGQRIEPFGGVPYIEFVLPGVLMMNVIMAAFSQAAFSVYFHRFARHIEELLVAPLSNFELILAFLVGGVIRAVVTGAGIYVIAIFFGAARTEHIWLLLGMVLVVSVVFALIGILVGLWSKSFEQLGLLPTFILTPLTFVGGVFNPIGLLPEPWQTLARANPFFYFIDGIRYAMINVREADPVFGLFLLGGLVAVLYAFTVWVFKKGYGLRN